MDTQNKCCGNCKYFRYEDVGGWGICIGFSKEFGVHCSHVDCLSHTTTERIVNGWTEITPDNVDMIDDGSIIIVTDGIYYTKASDWHLSLGTMAKSGGYYYYELPELKLEKDDNEGISTMGKRSR